MRYAVSVAPRPHPRVVESSLGADLALFHLDTRRLHVLNGSAAAIWRQLQVSETIGDLAVRLGDTFDVSPIEIRGDVERTVEQLRADGLLELDDRATLMRPPAAATAALPYAVDAPLSGSFAALDARIGLVCGDEELARTIEEALHPLVCTAAPKVAIEVAPVDDTAWTITVGDRAPITLGSRLSVALRVIGEVNNLAVASVPDDLVFHAGAVAAGGRGVLLPGGSNHGKSTLTTALVAAGYSYLTDEAAAVDADLTIRPFAKSIALDPGSFPLFPELAPSDRLGGLARAVAAREWHVDPSQVGPVSGPAPVTVVICPQWRAGAATRVSEVPGTDALHLLLGDTFDFSIGGQPVFERLVRLVESVPVVKLTYGETDAAVAAVGDVLAASA